MPLRQRSVVEIDLARGASRALALRVGASTSRRHAAPARATIATPGGMLARPEAWMQEARYARLYADDRGESHFADVDLALPPVDFAPPAAPLNVAPLFPAARCFVVGGPADWAGDAPHPAPRRQLFCFLRGELEVTASDGETRRFLPGGVLLLEDTTGKGHATRVVAGEEFLILGVALAD